MSKQVMAAIRPVILIPRGCLSTTAMRELRKAGYSVIQAADTDKVRQFMPETFKDASMRAKVAAFEHAIADSQSDNYPSKDQLRSWYINFLKHAKSF